MSALSLLYRGCLGPDRVKNDVFYRDCVSNRTPHCSILANNFSAKLWVHVIWHPVYVHISLFSQGACLFRVIHLEVFHSYRARQPPFLTSVTSIFGHNVDRIHVYYIYILYILYILYIYVVVFPWFYLVLGQSLGFFTHNLWRFGLFSQFAQKTLTV